MTKCTCQSAQLDTLLASATQIHRVASHLATELPPVEGGYWLAAGCVVQAVWNAMSGKKAEHGVKDYDIVYFSRNESLERAKTLETMLQDAFPQIEFDVKNQAHVYRWFPKRFGRTIPAYRSLTDALVTWPSTATATAIQLNPRTPNHFKVLAPFGLHDLLSKTVRPVRSLVSPEIYLRKTQRWLKHWPDLNILPFEAGLGPFEINGCIDLPPITGGCFADLNAPLLPQSGQNGLER